MEEKEILDLYESIKKDNLKTFTFLVQKNVRLLNLSYGRFPLLSLCYLFKSKKIVKAYEKRLNEPINYIFCDEPIDAYEIFKAKAKKNLRYYVFSEKNVVTPIQMLAVTGDLFYLEKSYNSLRKSQSDIENIKKVFINDSINSEITEDNIRIAKPINKLFKVITPIIISICLLMTILPFSLLGIINLSYGQGKQSSPFKINNLTDFINSYQSEGIYFNLTCDIIIPNDFIPNDYLANLNGNGYSIKSNGTPFISNLKGEIKNINLFTDDLDLNINQSNSVFIYQNQGTLKDVEITSNALIDINATEEMQFSFLTFLNQGTIENCNILADINVKSVVEANLSLSLLASLNQGLISNCTIKQNSKIIGETADISPVAYQNDEQGTIINCTNYSQISQSTNEENWNPISSGIVLVNDGTVENCFNRGQVSSKSDYDALNKNTAVVVGGIVGVNNGLIKKCKNEADIFAFSNKMQVYAGGISAVNNNQIDSCGSGGNLYVSSNYYEEELLLILAGGIAGHSYGSIENSFSYMTFTSENVNCYVGGISGLSYYIYNSANNILISYNYNNAYVYRENVESSTILFIVGGQAAIGYDENVVVAKDVEELKLLGLYWE